MSAENVYIQSPDRATVGQGIAVAAVDSSGVPILWKAVNFPSGGGLTQAQTAALDGMIRALPFVSDPASRYQAFCSAFGIGE